MNPSARNGSKCKTKVQNWLGRRVTTEAGDVVVSSDERVDRLRITGLISLMAILRAPKKA